MYVILKTGEFKYVYICWKSIYAKSQRSKKSLSYFAANFTCQKMVERTNGYDIPDIILTNREELKK